MPMAARHIPAVLKAEQEGDSRSGSKILQKDPIILESLCQGQPHSGEQRVTCVAKMQFQASRDTLCSPLGTQTLQYPFACCRKGTHLGLPVCASRGAIDQLMATSEQLTASIAKLGQEISDLCAKVIAPFFERLPPRGSPMPIAKAGVLQRSW